MSEPTLDPQTRRFSLSFGALAPSLATQLDKKPSDVKTFQKDADAITRLLIHGLISDSVGRQARQRLVNCIGKAFKS